MSEQCLKTEFNEELKLLTITLDRPDNDKNQISSKMMTELRAILEPELTRPNARGIMLNSAKPKVFSAGADIDSELKDVESIDASRFSGMGSEVFSLLTKVPCPTVALVSGFALGGGLEISLCCDFRIATKSSRMGLPEINLGIIPGWGGTQRLQRLIGRSRAMKMILTGDPVNAQTALEYGLVDEIVDNYEALLPAGEKLLKKLASKSSTAIGLAKRAVIQGGDTNLSEGLSIEREIFGLAWSTDDRREGIDAYLNKRKPSWPE